MKYTVTYSCGHTGMVELYGKRADRERKIAWYERFADCPECYKVRKAAEADQFETEHKLPALTGSEKQIAWARTIRVEKLIDVFKAIETARTLPSDTERLDELLKNASIIEGKINLLTSAKWWIEYKDNNIFKAIKEF